MLTWIFEWRAKMIIPLLIYRRDEKSVFSSFFVRPIVKSIDAARWIVVVICTLEKKEEKTLVFATAEDTKIRWEKKKSAGGDTVREKNLLYFLRGRGSPEIWIWQTVNALIPAHRKWRKKKKKKKLVLFAGKEGREKVFFLIFAATSFLLLLFLRRRHLLSPFPLLL